MNDREFRNRLNQDLPDAPEIFHRAMTDTLKTIVREEGKRRAASARKLRRTLLIAALITLLLASAAVAAYHWRLFDAVWFFNTPPASEGVARQSHLFEGTVNGVEVTVNEAVYDGRTLYRTWTCRWAWPRTARRIWDFLRRSRSFFRRMTCGYGPNASGLTAGRRT